MDLLNLDLDLNVDFNYFASKKVEEKVYGQRYVISKDCTKKITLNDVFSNWFWDKDIENKADLVFLEGTCSVKYYKNLNAVHFSKFYLNPLFKKRNVFNIFVDKILKDKFYYSDIDCVYLDRVNRSEVLKFINKGWKKKHEPHLLYVQKYYELVKYNEGYSYLLFPYCKNLIDDKNCIVYQSNNNNNKEDENDLKLTFDEIYHFQFCHFFSFILLILCIFNIFMYILH